MARSAGAPQLALVAETARALSGFAGDERGLVTACRRIVHRHPACGSLVWLAARALTATDARAELGEVAAAVAADPTSRQVAGSLPDDATLVVSGWPEVTVASLGRRGDLAVVVIDADGCGEDLVDALAGADVAGRAVPAVQVGAVLSSAVGVEGVVVAIEADMTDGRRAIAGAGSLAAVATARALGLTTWLVVPEGRCQPEVMVSAALARLDSGVTDPAGVDWDVVPTELIDVVVRPGGPGVPAEVLGAPDGPAVPELFAGDVF